MIYAVYDTNVLISSLLTKKTDTATAIVVDAIASQEIIPIYSDEIIEEYDEVLHRSKFGFSEKRINDLLEVIRQYGILVEPQSINETLPDMDDLIFYEVVMEKREADAYLITGNLRHFPERSYIVTPAEMLEIVQRERRKRQ